MIWLRLSKAGCRFLLVCAVLGPFCLYVGRAADAWPVNKAFTVQDCGTPLKELKLHTSTLYKHPDTGKIHLFLEFGANNGWGIGEKYYGEGGEVRHYLFDVELESGKMRCARGGNGHESAKHFLHPNGKIYLFEMRTCPATLATYDTRTGEYERLAHTGNAAYKVLLAPSGRIYSGEVGGSVSVYDPETDELTIYRQPAGRPIRWGLYTMEVEEPYIYCGMTNQGNWFLNIIDTRTGKCKSYFDVEKGQPKCHRGRGAHRTEKGNLFYSKYLLKDGDILCERGEDGEPIIGDNGLPVPITLPERDTSEHREGNRSWPNMWKVSGYSSTRYKEEEKLGLEIDLSQAEPTNMNDAVSRILWRKKGEDDWREILIEGMYPVGRSPKYLTAMPDGSFLGVSGYGMAFRFDPSTGKSVELGDPPGSVYDIMPFGGKIYFSGYAALFAEYDPALPYNYNKMEGKGWKDLEKEGSNPRRYLVKAKWYAYMAGGPDGRVYIGGYNGRHHTGGVLSIFDPRTKTVEHLRDPWFTYLGIKGLFLVKDGSALAITTAPKGKKQNLPADLEGGSIFIYDFEKKKIVKEMKLNFKANPDQIFVAGDGTIVGVSRMKETDAYDRDTHSTIVYGLDLESGKTLFEKKYAGRAFNGMLRNDHPPLVRGPDGCGWLFVDKDLCRIRPDGELERVRSMPETRGRMFFVDKTLYIYNGGRIAYRTFSNVIRIEDLFAAK